MITSLLDKGCFLFLIFILTTTFAAISSAFRINDHLKCRQCQSQSSLCGYKHETFNNGERTRSRRANKIEVSSYERAVVVSNAPRGVSKVIFLGLTLSLDYEHNSPHCWYNTFVFCCHNCFPFFLSFFIQKLVSDELTKQLVDADRQKGGEKKKDLLTGSELRKKAREVKTKKKGERIKSAKLEKKHQQQIIEASNNHRNSYYECPVPR